MVEESSSSLIISSQFPLVMNKKIKIVLLEIGFYPFYLLSIKMVLMSENAIFLPSLLIV